MSTTLVRNGTILTATDRYDADLYIDHGVVSLIGRGLTIPADRVVDASGLLVMPGGVDVHTHLDLPAAGTTSSDDFETGTIAAAHGGTTTIIDFATPRPARACIEASMPGNSARPGRRSSTTDSTWPSASSTTRLKPRWTASSAAMA